MTLTKAVKFYKEYEGLMSDEQIFEETGFSAERLRQQTVKNKGQLCWYCANACDDTKCEWVSRCNGVQSDIRINDYPDYVKTKAVYSYKRPNTEYITECTKYRRDGKSKC